MKLYNSITKELDRLNELSKKKTTCHKTYVGASIGIIRNEQYIPLAEGFNSNPDYNCLEKGCYRIQKFGTDSKKYRPYCKAIHAEENALKNLNTYEDAFVAVVTRYPCDHCTQLLIDAGVKIVYYGRPFKISKEAEENFNRHNVLVFHREDWIGDDNDNNR